MRPGRPTPLALIERDQMTQLSTSRADNRKSAAQMLDLARGFQQSALDDLAADRPLPATSSFHEAARIAITAVATANGRRFTNTSGHEAAVDESGGISHLSDRSRHDRGRRVGDPKRGSSDTGPQPDSVFDQLRSGTLSRDCGIHVA
jgi:hypothetical protein